MTSSTCLWDHLASIPDPRSPLGRRHALHAALSLITVAKLIGARSLEAIAQFARNRIEDFASLLGFTRSDTPRKASLSNLLRRLDVERVEAALSAWIAAGSADGSTPGVHLLASYAAETGAVLAQLRVDCKTREP